MKKLVSIVGFLICVTSHAAIVPCPDPQTSSLKWGEIPSPWTISPFSPHPAQADAKTRFVKANILVAGIGGRGAVCTYQNSVGLFSIWWPSIVKVPAREDYNWIDTYGGFVCTQSLESCLFSIATE